VEEQQAELSRVEIALADELHAERSATASAHQRETAMLNEAERLHMEEAILNAAIVETLQSSEDVKVRKDCTGNPHLANRGKRGGFLLCSFYSMTEYSTYLILINNEYFEYSKYICSPPFF